MRWWRPFRDPEPPKMPTHRDYVAGLWRDQGFSAVYKLCKGNPEYIEAAMDHLDVTSVDWLALSVLRRS